MRGQKTVINDLFEQNALTFLASIVTHSYDAIIGKTLDGTIISWNPGAERIYGYSSEEVLGKSIRLIYPSELEKEMDVILGKVAHGKRVESYETKRLRKDGTNIDVSITVSPIKDKNNKIIGASDVTRDISERKKNDAQKEFLIQASNLLSTSLDYNITLESVAMLAVQHLADWCAIDLVSDEGEVKQVAIAHKDPTMVEWAKKLREELPPDMTEPHGLPQVLKTGKAEFYPFLTDEMLDAMVQDETKKKLVEEIGIRSVMIVPLIVRKRTIGAITFVNSGMTNLFDQSDFGLAQDLAHRAAFAIENAVLFKKTQEELEERRRVEAALRDSEYKFRKLIESNLIGVLITNVNGTVYEVNKTMLDMLGYSQVEFKKQKISWNKLTPQKWHADDALAIEQVLNYGEALPREKEYIKKDGSILPVLIGTTLLDKKKGNCLTFVLDISEQKEIERRKDDFISVASHELKTPVTSIKVFTQLLAKRFNRNEDQQTLLLINKMDNQLNKLIVLISDLLDVSRIQAGKLALKPEPFSLNQLVEENIDAVKEITDHEIEFTVRDKVTVEADRERIGQVITNFLTNAIKYSPPQEKIIVSVEKNDKKVRVSVKDFGIGIAKDDQVKVFDRFYQASNSHVSTFPGLGMGLFISSEIVRRHQGEIGVESNPGAGSHFFFTIPLQTSSTSSE